MKRIHLLLSIVMLLCAYRTNAQVSLKAGPEHNAKFSMLTLTQHTNLSENTFTDTYNVFFSYYSDIRTINNDHSLSAGAAKLKNKQSAISRDEKLKAILTKAQMDIWISEVEPELNRQIKAN